MSFRSGPCTAKYSPASAIGGSGTAALGTAAPSYVAISQAESGFQVVYDLHEEPIHTDAGGGTSGSIVDSVNLGFDVTIRITAVDYDLIKTAIAAFGPIADPQANVGKLMSYLAGPLQIIPKAGTPNATEIGVGFSRFFYKAIPITNWEYLLSAGHNKGPMTFRCLPDPNHQNLIYIDATTV